MGVVMGRWEWWWGGGSVDGEVEVVMGRWEW